MALIDTLLNLLSLIDIPNSGILKILNQTIDYSSNIVSAIEKDNIFGTQFHPEKSDKLGLNIIENFINL